MFVLVGILIANVSILQATKTHQIEDNCKAMDLVPKLTDEVMEEIEKILDNKPNPPASFGRQR
jgi:aryl-alcohol dehydrogenase-like predicted oxidoreductase